MNTWSGDWEALADERARALGFDSVHTFLAAHPTESHVALAARLGGGVLGVHLERLELEHALAQGAAELKRAAMRSLVRQLEQPQGDDRVDVSGCSIWATSISAVDASRDGVGLAICRWLMANAPEGWRPEGESDPILKAAFDAEWR